MRLRIARPRNPALATVRDRALIALGAALDARAGDRRAGRRALVRAQRLTSSIDHLVRDDPRFSDASARAAHRHELDEVLEPLFRRQASADVFAALVDGADDITLLTRITTDWYVFVEYLVRLAAGGVRRLALLQSIQDGKLSGTYGYGI